MVKFPRPSTLKSTALLSGFQPDEDTMPDLEYWQLNGICTCFLRVTAPFMTMSDGISRTLLEYIKEVGVSLADVRQPSSGVVSEKWVVDSAAEQEEFRSRRCLRSTPGRSAFATTTVMYWFSQWTVTSGAGKIYIYLYDFTLCKTFPTVKKLFFLISWSRNIVIIVSSFFLFLLVRERFELCGVI